MGRRKKANELKLSYYSLNRIKKCKAHYNLIFGLRSNGKTFSVQEEGIINYWTTGKQMAIIRRYDVDFQGKRGHDTFSHFINNPTRGNILAEITNGEWTDIYYFSMRWYFCRYTDKNERVRKEEPFCFAFSLAGQEHDKSTSYPRITTILFDEFMTRGLYLNDEFVIFTNVLSTIIRERDDVTIYMCGNTVNKYNPYFKEMGLDNVLKMEPGDIQEYSFAVKKDPKTGKEVTLKIAVEYADNPNPEGKPSDVYFAFNNPKLKMITNGMWELAVYPHLPYKYKYSDIVGEYFIIWEEEILHCEIISLDDMYFTYIHSKTTPIKDNESDIVFTTEYIARPNYRRKITKPIDDIGRKIKWFYDADKVFYQDNEIGEVVRNYLNWCISDRGFV
jgi:hypothetical protein